MNEGEIRQLAQLQALIAKKDAILARIEGMKVDNSTHKAVLWDAAYFFNAQAELEEIAKCMREKI